MNLGFTNHKHSEETKRKMSEDRTGEKNSMYGKKRNMSEETRKKMSESHKGKVGANKGKTWEEMYGVEKAKEMRKERRQKYKGLGNPMYGKKRIFSIETKKRMSNGSKLTISKIKKLYPLFSKIEEMRYNPDKPGKKEIQVHCKNHNCPNSKEQGGWFVVGEKQKYQLSDRIRAVELSNGTNYFYCSDECKCNCPLYNNREHLRSDPLKVNDESYYTSTEYQVFRTNVLERDNYKCQYCGERAEHVHHERPQKLEPFFALDPDLAWSVCQDCHYKYGHSDKDCNTGNLANKKCENINKNEMKGVQLCLKDLILNIPSTR